MKEMIIGSKKIGGDNPTFIIAEVSANHLQDYDKAVQIIKEAKKCGADAIKLQTYLPQTITIDCDNEYFQLKKNSPHYGKSLYELYEEAYTPWEWQPKLKELTQSEGMVFFSSVFDNSSVDFLEKLNVPAYKISSFEIVDIPLIEYVAKKQKPIIISTGIATISDIVDAINACHKHGNYDIALLKCTSLYPSPVEELNLNMIKYFQNAFDVPVGLSDHTLDNRVVTASIALGAKIVERHLTLDRDLGGPDSAFSMEPHEFKKMVEDIRTAEVMLGEVSLDITPTIKGRRNMTKSLFVVKDIKKGEPFTQENIRSIRPGYGMAPKHYEEVLQKKAFHDIKAGTPLAWNMLE